MDLDIGVKSRDGSKCKTQLMFELKHKAISKIGYKYLDALHINRTKLC